MRLGVGDARGDYYGESAGSFMVKEFATMEQLEEIVKLASNPLPVSPTGDNEPRQSTRTLSSLIETYSHRSDLTVS